MRPRIVFGVQSAVHQAATLAQLARCLSDHLLLVHHDFSQQPDFKVDEPNVVFVREPERTGWGDWGVNIGIQKTVEQALAEVEFDYFQLLSPVDLPIRPIAEFEAFVAASKADFNNDVIRLDEDEMGFMTYAYRAYCREASFSYRLLWKTREVFLGPEPVIEPRACLAVPTSGRVGADGKLTPMARLAQAGTHAYVRMLQMLKPRLKSMPIYAGGLWFGATRRGCEVLVEAMKRPEIIARFKPMFSSNEMLFSSIFAGSGLPMGPANHVLSPFVGARPQWFELNDLDWLMRSDRFFGRKFPDDPDHPLRKRMLSHIGAASA